MPTIAALYRHPVKGLSPERIEAAQLAAGGHFPGDRLFALENGPSGFDVAAPEHMPKIRFLVLMRFEALARLETAYDDTTHRLTIREKGQVRASGDVRTESGRAIIERFFEEFLTGALRGPVKLIAAPQGHRFMDSRSGFVSILNRATIDAIAAMLGRASLDPLRFRGNVLVEDWPAFAENDLVGRRIRLGAAELEITHRIPRCAATDVDPTAAIRDVDMVGALERAYGHHDCGIYARVITGGTIRQGDRLDLLD